METEKMSIREDLEAELGMAEARWEQAKLALKSASDGEAEAFRDLIDARHALGAYLQGKAREVS